MSDHNLSSEQERALAVRLFDQAWELINLPGRTPAQDRRMLVTACAAWLHWDAVGNEENRAIADWQIAHAASLLGFGELALAYATSAHDRAQEDDQPGWLRASALEGLARAHAAAGHKRERDAYLQLATEAVGTITDREERELIQSQIATVPG